MNIRDLKKLPPEEFEALQASLSDDDLEALHTAMDKHEAMLGEKLQKLSRVIAEKRSEAIEYRVSSGIEKQWDEDEEHYEGVDDANRSEIEGNADVEHGGGELGEPTGSTIFINITKQYCDAAGASMADMLMPTDGGAFHVDSTPVPELLPFAEGNLPTAIRQQIQAEFPGNEQGAAQREAEIVGQAQSILQNAKDKAAKAQQRIEDWLVECQYHAHMRKVIEDAARVGTGVLKGPVPQKRRQVAYREGQLVINEEVKPGSQWISYRNLYPAKGCGENIHDGPYIFERDEISPKKLRELIELDGYLEKEILSVLDEGPTEATVKFKEVDDMQRDSSGQFEVWYFHGEFERDDIESVFESANYEHGEEHLPEVVQANVVMVNNRIIKAVLNPLDTGDFPYDVMVWQRRKGLPWGIGVSRQIRTPQRMINGAGRNLMDNAGLGAGPMWAFNSDIIRPIDGVATIEPRKGWELAEDAEDEDITKAFTYYKLDLMVNELQAIIYLALKLAEDVTGLPMIMQGQMGQQKMDTLGQTQILNNNANIVRRRIARLFDDLITEPHMRRYYAYLLQYGDDEEKGEFVIDAKGSSNLVERTIQKEKTLELLQLAQNPIYNLDPKKVAIEYLRAEKYDPKNFEYDDEEWKQLVQQMLQPQQSDPREAIAQLNAQVAEMREMASTQRKEMELMSKERLQINEFQFKGQIEQFSAELAKELAEMKYLGDKDINTDNLKVRINETTQRLMTQIRLSPHKDSAPQVATPAMEPPGRAPAGQAFAQ
ncbi:hypothetical protein HBA55_29665 [Pseudomaricurvus alkylphenolicus]|uniref:hypothetical protein n=1 Tax=Pseudomaricurvus alkylphenolicus TaxID=1306991 RepID=UPI00141E8E18|nr:hypothetical protein [Pseudomaricurvus alkylphenolicus]NIB43807.1 hypothetical protein [Pseudomaricurvus alkylphenolicus]